MDYISLLNVLEVMFFWVVTLCNDVGGYRRFGGQIFLHIHSP
jgi:hypothetical protein